MDQTQARRRAKTLGGIAVSARRKSNGDWQLGGWTKPDDEWIVVSRDLSRVLDDSPSTDAEQT